MKLNRFNHELGSDDESGDEEMSEMPATESDESDHLSQEEDEKANTQEMNSDEEQSEDESEEENPAGSGHPYPTPPPDVKANISSENGIQKVHVENSKPKVSNNKKSTKSKMATPKDVNVKPTEQMEKVAKKESTISLAMAAIESLANRSGSSVKAIVKYIKSTGFEVTDDRRFSRQVHRVLKAAVIRGELVQVKSSFKLSQSIKAKSKALANMQAKAEKKREKEKLKKAAAEEKAKKKLENEKQKKTAIKPKATANLKTKQTAKKPSERATKETTKKPKNPKRTEENAKTTAAAEVQAALEASQSQSESEPEPEMPSPEEAKPKPKPKAKSKAKPKANESDSNFKKAKPKAPARKSIGTLAQHNKGKPVKVSTKLIKKLVAGPSIDDVVDSAEYTDLTPSNSSTPINLDKPKRKARKQPN